MVIRKIKYDQQISDYRCINRGIRVQSIFYLLIINNILKLLSVNL